MPSAATALAAKIYTDCIHYYPFVLGAQPVRTPSTSPLYYAAVANERRSPQAHAMNSIEQNGQTIYEYPKVPAFRAHRSGRARASFCQLKTILQGVVARGTARAMSSLSPLPSPARPGPPSKFRRRLVCSRLYQ